MAKVYAVVSYTQRGVKVYLLFSTKKKAEEYVRDKTPGYCHWPDKYYCVEKRSVL